MLAPQAYTEVQQLLPSKIGNNNNIRNKAYTLHNFFLSQLNYYYIKKRNLTEMTSYLRHIAQHTDLSKGKCEIQISQTEIVWSSWDEESPLISTVLHWGNIFGTEQLSLDDNLLEKV